MEFFDNIYKVFPNYKYGLSLYIWGLKTIDKFSKNIIFYNNYIKIIYF